MIRSLKRANFVALLSKGTGLLSAVMTKKEFFFTCQGRCTFKDCQSFSSIMSIAVFSMDKLTLDPINLIGPNI